MAQLIIAATGFRPLEGGFIMVVSVTDTNGVAVKGLTKTNFEIFGKGTDTTKPLIPWDILGATESPDGFYTVPLKAPGFAPDPPSGHYVFAVIVKHLRADTIVGSGQTIAVSDVTH
jgi:hypothetical protein